MTAFETHLAERTEAHRARIEAEQDAELAALAEEGILAEPYDPWDPEEHHDDGWEAA